MQQNLLLTYYGKIYEKKVAVALDSVILCNYY